MITDLVRQDSIALEVNARRARPAQHAQQRSQDEQIEGAVSAILLDVSVLYFKTSRSLRHMVGPNVRSFRLLLEEQRAQLSAMIDQITARNRKMGVTVHRSVYQMIHQRSAQDKDAAYVQPLDILDDLYEDNKGLLARLKEACALCNGCLDIATTSLIEIWIDETARRNWGFSQAVE
ncbi:MAG: ferritin-like domain-containing protein [Steroidobacteraceae bacterium]